MQSDRVVKRRIHMPGTRIARTASAAALYRVRVGSLIVEALPVTYDQRAFAAEFKRQWPDNSPAALSYWQRINQGTDMTPEQACIKGFTLANTLCALEMLS